ncbi:AsmA family protein [Breoghania sp.]|uniref:AsmA family protein n=1 Tax=Breoghania sp. TaxID=2065378 RepID=UPI0029C9CE60|nr:AsmA family protein [Breoghania sp.]
MKRILVGAAGILLLLLIVALVIPFFLPKDAIKRQIVAEIEGATGWRLRVDGAVGISLLPSVSLTARDVGLSGEAGADGVEFAKVSSISFGLSLGALLGGNAHVTGITLREPRILLETDAAGRTSWAPRRTLSDLIEESLSSDLPAPGSSQADDGARRILPPAPGEERTVAQEAMPAEQAGDDLAALLRRVRVDDLSIVDGSLVFSDLRSGQAIRITAINSSLALPSPDEPAVLAGSFGWQERTFEVEAELGSPIALVQQRPSEISAKLSSDFGAATVSGRIAAQPFSGTLRIGLSGDSLNEALAALGTAAPGGRDLGAYDLAATADVQPERITIEDFALAAADSKATGRAVVDTGAAEPVVTASIAMDTLDLTRFGVTGLDPAAGRLEAFTLDFALDGLARPATAKGGFLWNGERFDISGSAAPEPLMAGDPAPVEVAVANRHLTVGARGNLTGGAFDGKLSLETANLRDMMAWLGSPLPPGNGLKAFAVAGKFSGSADGVAFRQTRISLDGTVGDAEGELSLGGARPRVSASLSLDTLVLDPYLGGGGSARSAGGNGGGRSAGGNGGAQASGWSTERIDFSGLKSVDADLAISASSIRWDKLTIGQSKLTVAIAGGKLKADLNPLNLYDGAASGTVRIDGTSAQPTVAASFSLERLEAHPFLRDLADFRALHGKTAITFDVTTAGASQAALASALSGKALVKFTNGSLRGINIPSMVRNLSAQTLLGWGDTGDEQATDFSELSASFDIANGVASTSDLRLLGPLVRVTGGGRTDIGRQTLDWRVEPRIVPTLEGQGNSAEMVGLGVPVVIKGSWANPRIYPDIKGILENPAEAYKQLQSVGGGLLDLVKKNPAKAVENTVKQLTGEGIDINKVMDGEIDDDAVLKTIEQGFKVAPNLFGIGKKKKQ